MTQHFDFCGRFQEAVFNPYFDGDFVESFVAFLSFAVLCFWSGDFFLPKKSAEIHCDFHASNLGTFLHF